jgi:hypothetical protein
VITVITKPRMGKEWNNHETQWVYIYNYIICVYIYITVYEIHIDILHYIKVFY